MAHTHDRSGRSSRAGSSRRRQQALLAALATALCCSSTAVEAQSRTIKIALIAKSEANFVFLAARRGAEEKAAALSRQHGVRIEVAWQTPAREDVAEQAARIRQAVHQKADAILLAASDGSALVSAVDAAVEQGVPVMTFDSDVAGSRRFAFFGADDAALGEKVAADLATRLGGKGQVAILAGNANATNLKARAEGVRRGLARQPQIEIVGTVHHAETPAAAVTELLSFGAAHPGLRGWAMVGGWPLFRSSQSPAMMGEIEKRGLRIVAVDALPEQLVYVERGLVPVPWAQPLYDWGAVGVSTIVDKLLLKKRVPERIPMELIRVTKDDIRSYARRLDSWGFSLPKEYLTAQ